MSYLSGRKVGVKTSTRKSSGDIKLDIDRYNENQIFLLPNSVYICVIEQTTPNGSDKDRAVHYISGVRKGNGNSSDAMAPGKVMLTVMENTVAIFDTNQIETKTVSQLNQLCPMYVGTLTSKGTDKLHRELGDSILD